MKPIQKYKVISKPSYPDTHNVIKNIEGFKLPFAAWNGIEFVHGVTHETLAEILNQAYTQGVIDMINKKENDNEQKQKGT